VHSFDSLAAADGQARRVANDLVVLRSPSGSRGGSDP